jgi:hypothetical protein
MMQGKRGVGKTHVGLGYRLRWQEVELSLSGKLPILAKSSSLTASYRPSLLQKWLAEIVSAIGCDSVDENLKLLIPDLQESGIPDLATIGGQASLTPFVAWADLVVLDNLSCLVRSGKENEAESWLPIQV